MTAHVQISNHALQQIAIANRLADAAHDAEAHDRLVARVKASEAAEMVKRVQKDDKVAEQIADEILGKFGTDEMVAVLRACFANKPDVAAKLILAHADEAILNLAEIEAIKYAEDARYA